MLERRLLPPAETARPWLLEPEQVNSLVCRSSENDMTLPAEIGGGVGGMTFTITIPAGSASDAPRHSVGPYGAVLRTFHFSLANVTIPGSNERKMTTAMTRWIYLSMSGIVLPRK